MAIRFLDTAANIARFSNTLQNASMALRGTFTPAPARTASITVTLQSASMAMQGVFTPLPNRTASIISTLQNATAAFRGTFSQTFAWLPFTVPPFTQGTASSFSFAAFTPPTTGDTYQLAAGSAALPTGVTLNSAGKSLDYNGTGPVASVSGIVLENVPSALADWLARSTGPGVVKAYKFDSAAEVDAFRWINGFGNDPNSTRPGSSNCRWVSNDGIAGSGCLELERTANVGTEPASWWLPFAPFSAGGNGLAVDDPAASGTLTRRTWNPNNPNMHVGFDAGWYGHSDYRTDSTWDGGEFFIQYQEKTSASRWQGATNQGLDGKIAYVATTGSTPTQEILMQSRRDRRFYIYTGFGSPGPLEFLLSPQDYNTSNPPANLTYQPGGAFDATCRVNQLNSTNCFYWTPDEWVTVLFHLTPGHGVSNDWGPADHWIQIYVARPGATSYTKVYDKPDYQMFFQNGKKGWNAFQASIYYNGASVNPGFTQRYRGVILSKQFIPCPQA